MHMIIFYRRFKSHLKKNAELVLIWVERNYMKLNIDNCHLIVPSYKHEHVCAKTSTAKIQEKKNLRLLGINVNNELQLGN